MVGLLILALAAGTTLNGTPEIRQVWAYPCNSGSLELSTTKGRAYMIYSYKVMRLDLTTGKLEHVVNAADLAPDQKLSLPDLVNRNLISNGRTWKYGEELWGPYDTTEHTVWTGNYSKLVLEKPKGGPEQLVQINTNTGEEMNRTLWQGPFAGIKGDPERGPFAAHIYYEGMSMGISLSHVYIKPFVTSPLRLPFVYDFDGEWCLGAAARGDGDRSNAPISLQLASVRTGRTKWTQPQVDEGVFWSGFVLSGIEGLRNATSFLLLDRSNGKVLSRTKLDGHVHGDWWILGDTLVVSRNKDHKIYLTGYRVQVR